MLSYGLRDKLDVLLTLPYSRADAKAGSATTTVHGLGDVDVDAKWRFFEEGRLGVALKTGAPFATGDDTRNLGAGKFNVGVNLVTSYETALGGCYLHLGQVRIRNVRGERNVIHHASVALIRTVSDRLKRVADLGRFSSTDRSTRVDARILTLGALLGVRDDFDIDLGVKRGLSDPETDTTPQMGIARRL